MRNIRVRTKKHGGTLLHFRQRQRNTFLSRLKSTFYAVIILSALFGFAHIQQIPQQVKPAYAEKQQTIKTASRQTVATGGIIACDNPYIIDGDTLDCNGTRIRLASIDAPEMPDHCPKGKRCVQGDPFAAKNYLTSLSANGVKCQAVEIDKYGRTVATCEAAGKDLSCAMVRAGQAVERYGTLICST